jgi:hypothetical protein
MELLAALLLLTASSLAQQVQRIGRIELLAALLLLTASSLAQQVHNIGRMELYIGGSAAS